ncbi:MAG TPA: DnaJ domain-containing protein [Candidatus Limnocylindria bacterium]|nr:DnaJ domain-containing protein [Candidatus Limnocylindria bacterium]
MNDRDAYEILHVHPKAHPGVIKAAYRFLAALYHPDSNDELSSDRRMAELNAAYDRVRTADRRQLYDNELKRGGPGASVVVAPPPRASAQTQAATPGVLDFGRYQGWTIADLARQDPDYLRWLSRHSSGVRFRHAIEAALAKTPTEPSMSDRLRGPGKSR